MKAAQMLHFFAAQQVPTHTSFGRVQEQARSIIRSAVRQCRVPRASELSQVLSVGGSKTGGDQVASHAGLDQ